MRRDEQRLLDILEALDSIQRMIAGRTEAGFLRDETLRYAIAQRLTVAREAAARIGIDMREKYASIPWADIIALRNILVHEYFGIYWPLVWQTAIEDAPALSAQIGAIVIAEFPE